jgi:competence protein ComEC
MMMKTPLSAAALGMAAGYYVCSGLGGTPGLTLLFAVFSCVLSAAGITALGMRFEAGLCGCGKIRRRREGHSGGFAPAFLVVIFASGLFAGLLVHRHSAAREASLYWGFEPERIVVFGGVVQADSWRTRNGNILAPVSIDKVWDRADNSAGASAGVLALFDGDEPGRRFFRGDRLRLSGSLSSGEEGVFFLLAREAALVGTPPAFFQGRKNLLRKIEGIIGGFETYPFRAAWPGLFTALLLGSREKLDTELAERFRRAGAVHILALSGMHLGLLALLARLCLKPFIRGRAGDIIVLAFVFAYLWLAGPSPSLMRAALMFAGYTALLGLERRPGMTGLLAFSFVISAVFFPEDLKSLSFILSYLAMLGILLFTAPLTRFFRRWIPDPLVSPFAVSLAAQITVSPVLLVRFGLIYPGGIAASLALGPLVTAFMWTGILACAAASALRFFPLLWIFQVLMKYLYAAIVLVVELCARLPAL